MSNVVKFIVGGSLFVLLLWFSLGFLSPLLFKNAPDNAGTFGDGFGSVSALFNGFGLVATITAGYLVYLTYGLQARTLTEQSKQVAQDQFYKLLDNFVADKREDDLRLDSIVGFMWSNVHNKIKAEYGKVTVPNDLPIVTMYLHYLNDKFIRSYSYHKATPRLEPAYVRFFKHINAIAYFFLDIKRKGYNETFLQLRSMLLSRMTDGEIQMTCYYYYIYYDIINSRDEYFTCENPVTLSGVFEGPLFLSDDFSRNIDPRDKEGGFRDAISPYRDQVARQRIAAKVHLNAIRQASPERYSEPDEMD